DHAEVLLRRPADVGNEAHALAAGAALDDPLDPGEGAAADEQDVRGVDLDELLVRVLAATLRRHRGGGALQDLQERLLHPFTRDVTRDRRVLRLAGDLVDLVDVDDAGLGLLDVVVGGLDELEEDVLDVFAHIDAAPVDQLLHLILALSAARTLPQVPRITELVHDAPCAPAPCVSS